MNEDYEDSDRRAKERKAAMDLAHRAAIDGCPVSGGLFGFLHSIKHDLYAEFEDDFYYWSDDDSDDIRPY